MDDFQVAQLNDSGGLEAARSQSKIKRPVKSDGPPVRNLTRDFALRRR